jgi:hypothetical protein
MSTKIYDGMRAVDTDPFVAASKIRAVLNPMFVKRLVAQTPDPKGLRDAHKQMLTLKATATFDPLDVGFDVILMPALEGPPLVLLYSEEARVYRRALVRAHACTDFSYWDNSDKPRNVTKAEWEERRRQWESVGVPSECGLLLTEPGYVTTMLLRRQT